MLIICNGAPKSGSTWMWMILQGITKYPPIPSKYQNASWSNPSIDPCKLQLFLQEKDFSQENYACKNHFNTSEARDLIMGNNNVKIFNIERDLRDAVVSWYYHKINMDRCTYNFEEYFWKTGVNFIKNLIEYHKMWGEPNSSLFVSSYLKLKKDFKNEVFNIGKHIGFSLSESDIQRIENVTKFNKHHEKSEKFFRKGVIGDWENHLTDDMLLKIEELELSSGFKKKLA